MSLRIQVNSETRDWLGAKESGDDAMGVVLVDGQYRTVQKVSISEVTVGDRLIVAAQGAGKKIRILYLSLQNTGAADNTLIFKDGATAINGAGFLLKAGGGSYTFDSAGLADLPLAANAAFNINLSAASQISGFALYIVEG